LTLLKSTPRKSRHLFSLALSIIEQRFKISTKMESLKATGTTEILCPICLSTPEDPVNLFSDNSPERTCKECISAYIKSNVSSAYLGSCPTISCPSTTHKKKRILPYKEWAAIVPKETTKRYSELAGSVLAFLCGGCHTLKSLDVGFESDQTGTSYHNLEKYLASTPAGGGAAEGNGKSKKKNTVPELIEDIQAYSIGEFTVEEFYRHVTDKYFSSLQIMADAEAWKTFVCLLKMIVDPERRVNLHLRYLRDHPRIKTACCNREHCFRCKMKDYHEGRSCVDASGDLDNSVVCCPSCGIALARGDGCNTITCVCGKQFSWSSEKENTNRCQQFLLSYPENTSSHCASLLCSEHPNSAIQQAKAWQIRNRHEVSRALHDWFKLKYSPCVSQSCATLNLDSTLPVGVREAADIWRKHHPEEVSKCIQQRDHATDSFFLTLFPDPATQAVAAHKLVHTIHGKRFLLEHTLPATDVQMLVKSAACWIRRHKEQFNKGVLQHEIRQAKQFLYLYGNKMPYMTIPSCEHGNFVFEWDRELSNDDLTFTNENTSVERVGSVSCYPAAFARLVADHCLLRIVVDKASRTSNWLTFGLARAGMQATSSDGVGRTSNTWGVADDRSSSADATVSASGSRVGRFRKFQCGDVLTCEVDVCAGWCDVSLNDRECEYRFDIPSGTMNDYYFAMTFANDHQVSINCDVMGSTASTSNGSASASTSGKVGASTNVVTAGGCLNAEHSFMYNCFRRQLKNLLVEPLDSLPSTAATTASSATLAGVSSTSSSSTLSLQQQVRSPRRRRGSSYGSEDTYSSGGSSSTNTSTSSQREEYLEEEEEEWEEEQEPDEQVQMHSAGNGKISAAPAATAAAGKEEEAPLLLKSSPDEWLRICECHGASDSNKKAMLEFDKIKASMMYLISPKGRVQRASNTSPAAAAAGVSPSSTSRPSKVKPCSDGRADGDVDCSTGTGKASAIPATAAHAANANDEDAGLPLLTWTQILHAASWYHDNRRIIEETERADLAFMFMLTHNDSAPFIAAMNLAEFHQHNVQSTEARASLAFMQIYAQEMHAWYDYDANSKEPMIENVARNCRCLPRHTRSCPNC